MFEAIIQAVHDEIFPPRVPRGVEEALWNRRESLKFAYAERVATTTNPAVWGTFNTRYPGGRHG